MLGVAAASAAVELILDDKARVLLVAAGPATAGAREEAREVDVGVAAAWLVVVLLLRELHHVMAMEGLLAVEKRTLASFGVITAVLREVLGSRSAAAEEERQREV